MVYISSDGQIINDDGWSIRKLKQTFWNFIDGFLLFFQTLIPGANPRNNRYITSYHRPGVGGSSTQRRLGRPNNISGIAAPPCGAGG